MIEQAKKGHESARAELLERYRPYLRLTAEQVVERQFERRFDGSDVVQETLVEAHVAFTSFRGQAEREFSAWLTAILRHNIQNMVRANRAKKRDVALETAEYDSSEMATLSWHSMANRQSSPSARLITGEKALELAAAIDGLSPDQRVAVRLRFLEGLKLREVAERMNWTVPQAAGFVDRGLKGLRKLLPEPSTLCEGDQ